MSDYYEASLDYLLKGEQKMCIRDSDISELSLKNYNRKIAYVSQDNYLFDNTIRENIRMGDLCVLIH